MCGSLSVICLKLLEVIRNHVIGIIIIRVNYIMIMIIIVLIIIVLIIIVMIIISLYCCYKNNKDKNGLLARQTHH